MVVVYRGLQNFIREIRACATEDHVAERIQKELTHIRDRFNRDSSLSPYQIRKYVLKLIYICLSGYPVNFGMVQASQLIASPDIEDKVVGYQFSSFILDEKSDFTHLITAQLLKDIQSGSSRAVDPLPACCALNTVANIGSASMAETLVQPILDMLISPPGSLRTIVRKKSALALLRLYRKAPDLVPVQEYASKLIGLLDVRNIGFLMSALSLLIEMCGGGKYDRGVGEQWGDERGAERAARCAENARLLAGAAHRTVALLSKIVLKNEVSTDHVYAADPGAGPSGAGIPAPWLQVKLLRLLQFLPLPEADSTTAHNLENCLVSILATNSVAPPISKGQTLSPELRLELHRGTIQFSIMQEALATGLHGGFLHPDYIVGRLQPVGDPLSNRSQESEGAKSSSRTRPRRVSSSRRRRALSSSEYCSLSKIVKGLAGSEPNRRYVTLRMLGMICARPEFIPPVQKHIQGVIDVLNTSGDPTERQVALQLLFRVALGGDPKTAQNVAEHLTTHLENGFCLPSMRNDVLLAASIVSERSATLENKVDQRFVNTTIRLLAAAGGDSPAEVSHRLCNMVGSAGRGVQAHAAKYAFALLEQVSSAASSELAEVAAWFIGEHCRELATLPTGAVPFERQLEAVNQALHGRYAKGSSVPTRLLMSAVRISIAARLPKEHILSIIQPFVTAPDFILQQRAVELFVLIKKASYDTIERIIGSFPPPSAAVLDENTKSMIGKLDQEAVEINPENVEKTLSYRVVDAYDTNITQETRLSPQSSTAVHSESHDLDARSVGESTGLLGSSIDAALPPIPSQVSPGGSNRMNSLGSGVVLSPLPLSAFMSEDAPAPEAFPVLKRSEDCRMIAAGAMNQGKLFENRVLQIGAILREDGTTLDLYLGNKTQRKLLIERLNVQGSALLSGVTPQIIEAAQQVQLRIVQPPLHQMASAIGNQLIRPSSFVLILARQVGSLDVEDEVALEIPLPIIASKAAFMPVPADAVNSFDMGTFQTKWDGLSDHSMVSLNLSSSFNLADLDPLLEPNKLYLTNIGRGSANGRALVAAWPLDGMPSLVLLKIILSGNNLTIEARSSVSGVGSLASASVNAIIRLVADVEDTP